MHQGDAKAKKTKKKGRLSQAVTAICVKLAYFLIERKLRATLAVTLHKFPTYETKELGHFGESCLSRTSYVIFYVPFVTSCQVSLVPNE